MSIAAVVVGAILLVVSLIAAAVLLARAVLPRAWRHRIAPQAAWWRWATAVPERRTATLPAPPATPRVAGRYLSLYTYLEHRYASNVVLTFEQMESLLGFALPAPARSERDWWTSRTDDLDRHSDAWTVACRTATPNLLARTVAFERVL